MTSGVNFINVLCAAFMHTDPESVKSSVSSNAFGIRACKSCEKNVVEIEMTSGHAIQ